MLLSSVGCAKGYRADDRSFSLFVLCGLAGLQDGQDISTEGDAAGCTSAVLCMACFCLDGHWVFCGSFYLKLMEYIPVARKS